MTGFWRRIEVVFGDALTDRGEVEEVQVEGAGQRGRKYLRVPGFESRLHCHGPVLVDI